MPLIDLDRQFIDWSNADGSDPDLLFYRGFFGNKVIDWEALRKRHRVVILAEAGSGKSSELLRQSELVKDQGNYSVYATSKILLLNCAEY